LQMEKGDKGSTGCERVNGYMGVSG